MCSVFSPSVSKLDQFYPVVLGHIAMSRGSTTGNTLDTIMVDVAEGEDTPLEEVPCAVGQVSVGDTA
jgi:hypothetical protein